MTGFSKTIPINASSSNNAIQSTPDSDTKNPIDDQLFVNSIEIIPDTSMQAKGHMVVMINRFTVFDSRDSGIGFFSRYNSFVIPLTVNELERWGHIEIWIWNGLEDSSPISFTGSIELSDKPVSSSKVSIPSNIDLNSKAEVLFPFQSYPSGTDQTQQFDMKGYRRIKLIMNPVYSGAPTFVSGNWGNNSAIFDGDLTTKTGLVHQPQNATLHEVCDFGDNSTRKISCKFFVQAFGGSGTTPFGWSLEGSNDPTFATGVTTLASGSESIPQGIDQTFTGQDSGTSTFRYARINMSGGIWDYNLAIFEMYDGLVLGGTAQVSFQVKDPAKPTEWIDTIKSTDIGSVTLGQKVVLEIGDTLTQGSNLNKTLITDYASFRARLIVTGGGISLGVSIIRVS